MSNVDPSDSVWVGDLDGYISISAINEDYFREGEERARSLAFEKIGDISLMNECTASSDSLQMHIQEPGDWEWALHEARNSFAATLDSDIEKQLVRSLIALGRPYAIARYCKYERVSFPSGLMASLPLGLNALLNQYLIGQKLDRVSDYRKRVREGLHVARNALEKIAYNRAGQIQTMLHTLAFEATGIDGPASLDRDATRTMLSLARLHFSVMELRLESFGEAATLAQQYQLERAKVEAGDHIDPIFGNYIPNWSLRHLKSLFHFFPSTIRHAFERGINHSVITATVPRDAAINELALAHCGIRLRRRGRS